MSCASTAAPAVPASSIAASRMCRALILSSVKREPCGSCSQRASRVPETKSLRYLLFGGVRSTPAVLFGDVVRPLCRLVQAVAGDLVVEQLAAYAEPLCRPCAIAVRQHQGATDNLSLQPGHRFRKRASEPVGIGQRATRVQEIEVGCCHDGTAHQNRGPFHRIAKLAHVPWPGMYEQSAGSIGRETLGCSARGRKRQEML